MDKKIFTLFHPNFFVYDCSSDGASEEMIESILEDSYNLQSIPLDLRLSYRIHNGQTSSSHGSIPG